MNLFLCGYMGAGKSTVGKALSKALNSTFIDLDTLIEIRCNLSIKEIFNRKGEAFFRKMETEALNELLTKHENAIIALGGGTLIKEENRIAIHANGKIVYLETSPEKILKRIKLDSIKRPLLSKFSDDSELLNYINSHLKERLKFYQEADNEFCTDDKTVNDIVKELTLITKDWLK